MQQPKPVCVLETPINQRRRGYSVPSKVLRVFQSVYYTCANLTAGRIWTVCINKNLRHPDHFTSGTHSRGDIGRVIPHFLNGTPLPTDYDSSYLYRHANRHHHLPIEDEAAIADIP